MWMMRCPVESEAFWPTEKGSEYNLVWFWFVWPLREHNTSILIGIHRGILAGHSLKNRFGCHCWIAWKGPNGTKVSDGGSVARLLQGEGGLSSGRDTLEPFAPLPG
jgi:hypothetical protein